MSDNNDNDNGSVRRATEDAEVKAIKHIMAKLDALGVEAKARVLIYIIDRYEPRLMLPPAAPGIQKAGPMQKAQEPF